MAAVVKYGGAICGLPVPEWDRENLANTNIVISIDNITIDPETWGEVMLEISGKITLYDVSENVTGVFNLTDATGATILLRYNSEA